MKSKWTQLLPSFTKNDSSKQPKKLHQLHPVQEEPTTRKKVRVLSIDGGGIRGILPATILCYLEERLQEQSGNPDARLADYFDFIAGTSTGGILTCVYLLPDADDPSRPKYTAKDALDLYKDQGDDIFDCNLFQKLRNLSGMVNRKFAPEGINECLQSAFGSQSWLRDFVKPGLVTAYDLSTEQAFFFSSESARKKRHQNFRIWEVARATSAAPSYFQPAPIKSETDKEHFMIDGGVIANNPALCAFTEACKIDFSAVKGWSDRPALSAEDMMLVSIGTGDHRGDIGDEDLNNKGLLGWLRPIVFVRMIGTSGTTEHHLQRLFYNHETEQVENYYRIQPELFEADKNMDNASELNIARLHQAGLSNVLKFRAQLDEIVDKLIENHAMVQEEDQMVRKVG